MPFFIFILTKQVTLSQNINSILTFRASSCLLSKANVLQFCGEKKNKNKKNSENQNEILGYKNLIVEKKKEGTTFNTHIIA